VKDQSVVGIVKAFAEILGVAHIIDIQQKLLKELDGRIFDHVAGDKPAIEYITKTIRSLFGDKEIEYGIEGITPPGLKNEITAYIYRIDNLEIKVFVLWRLKDYEVICEEIVGIRVTPI